MKNTNKLIFGQVPGFRRSHRQLYDLETITFNRVFSNIESEKFEQCFIEWVHTLADLQPREVVAIDGKTIKGAKSGGGKSPVHTVSAWANENNLVLGQVKVNEITAVPKLLLKNEKSSKVSVKSRRKKAGWYNHYPIKALNLMKV